MAWQNSSSSDIQLRSLSSTECSFPLLMFCCWTPFTCFFTPSVCLENSQVYIHESSQSRGTIYLDFPRLPHLPVHPPTFTALNVGALNVSQLCNYKQETGHHKTNRPPPPPPSSTTVIILTSSPSSPLPVTNFLSLHYKTSTSITRWPSRNTTINLEESSHCTHLLLNLPNYL